MIPKRLAPTLSELGSNGSITPTGTSVTPCHESHRTDPRSALPKGDTPHCSAIFSGQRSPPDAVGLAAPCVRHDMTWRRGRPLRQSGVRARETHPVKISANRYDVITFEHRPFRPTAMLVENRRKISRDKAAADDRPLATRRSAPPPHRAEWTSSHREWHTHCQ
jgi:hypothetical protein